MKTKGIIGSMLALSAIGLLVYYFYQEPKLPLNTQIDLLVIYKSKHQLLAYSNGVLVKTYSIATGRKTGVKQYEGDEKTPEGVYYINGKNADSRFYKNLGISYPEQRDVVAAAKAGQPTGGDIKIHGLRNGLGFIGKFERWFNWTGGCIALTDPDMDELYNAVKVETRVEINS